MLRGHSWIYTLRAPWMGLFVGGVCLEIVSVRWWLVGCNMVLWLWDYSESGIAGLWKFRNGRRGMLIGLLVEKSSVKCVGLARRIFRKV